MNSKNCVSKFFIQNMLDTFAFTPSKAPSFTFAPFALSKARWKKLILFQMCCINEILIMT